MTSPESLEPQANAPTQVGTERPPLIPTQEFADRMAISTGIYRSRLDPIVMMAWSFATKPPDPGDLIKLTGI